jgi:hypothetical protein
MVFYQQVLEFPCPSKFLCQTSGRQNHWSLLHIRHLCNNLHAAKLCLRHLQIYTRSKAAQCASLIFANLYTRHSCTTAIFYNYYTQLRVPHFCKFIHVAKLCNHHFAIIYTRQSCACAIFAIYHTRQSCASANFALIHTRQSCASAIFAIITRGKAAHPPFAKHAAKLHIRQFCNSSHAAKLCICYLQIYTPSKAAPPQMYCIHAAQLRISHFGNYLHVAKLRLRHFQMYTRGKAAHPPFLH